MFFTSQCDPYPEFKPRMATSLILVQLEADYHREYQKVLDVLESVNKAEQVETAINYAHLFFKKYPTVNPLSTLIYTYLLNFKTKFNLE